MVAQLIPFEFCTVGFIEMEATLFTVVVLL